MRRFAPARSGRVVKPDPDLAQEDQVAASLAFRPMYRLRKTDEYSSVFAFRRAVRSDHLMLHFRPTQSDSARLGVVVAKKMVRQAVTRNLLKRLSREAFRHLRDTLPHYDLILRVSRPVAKLTRAQLRLEIESLLKRLPRERT